MPNYLKSQAFISEKNNFFHWYCLREPSNYK